MDANTPRLTDLPGERHPQRCQSCGLADPLSGLPGVKAKLTRWVECDEHDRKQHLVVVLCGDCSDRLVGPHPRLYEALQPAAPWPGCMAICLDCALRDGTRCTSPFAKANGGHGVELTIARPLTAMVDGSKYRGPVTMWSSPASACRQKVADESNEKRTNV